MKTRFRLASLLFWGLTAFFVVISTFCFVSALSWISKPFAGFLVYQEPYVGTFNNRAWPGPQAGLRALDKIISVDGQRFLKSKEFVDAIEKKTPGTQVHYVVQSKSGEVRELTLPVITFTLGDFFLVFFFTFLGGLILYVFGFLVYVLKPNTSTSWVFLLFSLSVAIYMITGFEILTSYHLVRFHYMALSLFSGFLFHLGLIFPERKRILNRLPFLEYIIYIPGIALCVGLQIYCTAFLQGTTNESLWWVVSLTDLASIARILTLISLVSLVGFLIHSVLKASSTQARQRARMILIGVGIAFVTSGVSQALVFFAKINIPWNLLVFLILFFPASIAYSIVRHNLFDADVIIRRTVGYAVVTAVVVGAYVGVSLGLNVFMGKYQLARSQAFPILFTLGIILVFNPLRNRIQALVDRVFFRKEYDYGAIVEKVGGAMTSMLDLGQILERLTRTFIEDMFINTSSVMLLSSAGTDYQVYLADGDSKQDVEKAVFKTDEPLMEIIEGKKTELTKYDVLEDPKYKSVSETCAANFETLHASLMVPLVYQEHVIGSLNIGEKKSGKPFNRQDIELLRTLASQGAVAIENARLFQENLEKQRMEEELNIARDLQMSMLPATCPEVKGYQIAASSAPAREVGGDFYDFIEIEDDKVGLVVADVTGKSVSGALVMSSSRSVFRMLSEERLNVGDIMTRANRRIKQDIKSGMFVALLYAVLDARKGKVLLCSAGQTQPIHLSSRDGAAKLVETKGDSFPLGILDQADYRETEVWLPPGDVIVFYTDGIVEAMNEEEEILGFERLLEIVQSGASMTAEELHREILDKVSEYAGTAAQHDDLTVIVVKAAREEN